MARRCYIDQHIIRSDLAARAYGSRPNEYSTQCHDMEPVGMDGRLDWFRWHCRDCDRKYISPRNEKGMARYQCIDCGAWHFVYKGFFDVERSSTVPLRPDEVEGELARAKLAYDSDAHPDEARSNAEWHYGNPEKLAERVETGPWVMVEHIQGVEA